MRRTAAQPLESSTSAKTFGYFSIFNNHRHDPFPFGEFEHFLSGSGGIIDINLFEAYPLPGTTPGETYLNQENIIKIAKQCGADAIHPGYGFLSENPGFVKKCTDNNICFIGPPAEAIRLMGIKTEARQCMTDAGVPVIPGTEALDTAESAQASADR